MRNSRHFFLLHHKWYIAVLEITSVLISIIALIILLNPNEKNIYIAAVIPENIDNKQTGKSIKDALDIYAERINKYGGINGNKLQMIFYDDHGDIKKAQEIARTIVKENKAVAVIGHFSDSTTQAAGKIYHNAKIPIISPIANIKPDKIWQFQLSPTQASYGIYMANYIKSALKKDKVILIHDKNHYEQKLIDSFSKTFTEIGGQIALKSILHNHTKQKDTDIARIVDILKQKIKNNHINQDHILLISTPEEITIPLIVALKKADLDIPIMSSNRLINKFKHIKEEKTYSGYYSNGIYTPEVLINDGINTPSLALVRKDYEIRNTHKINSIAMLTTFAAIPLVAFLKRDELNAINDIETKRNRIRQLLKGLSWFDKNQIAKESILHIGIYKNNTLITAPVNPIIINNGDLPHSSEKKESEKTLKINNTTLYMSDFVYTGVSMKKINKINFNDLSYHLDFYLWFRYKKGVKHADDIEFINTVSPIKLFDLLKLTKDRNKQESENILSAKLVESQVLGDEIYRRYHIKAEFQTHKQKNYAVGQQNLYIRFRNNQSNTFQLRYLTDTSSANQGVFHPESGKSNDSLIDQKDLKLNYNFEYISTSHKTTLGDPIDLSRSTRFSEFVAEYRVEYTLWSFRGIAAWVNKKLSGRKDQINTALMIILVLISFTIFNFTRYIKRKNDLAGIPTYLWLLQLFTIFLILLFGEFALSQAIFDLKYSDWGIQNRAEIKLLMLYTAYIIATLWWIIPAYYISSAIDQFLWKPIQYHTGTKIPAVLHLFIVILIYVGALLGIMAFVFDITVTGMAATSGVIALMFAIASKVDLSNIIAGLGISFSKTFKLGDWVNINNSIEGKVIQLSPRSTNILTADASIISVPNTTVANAVIKNYNRPNSNFRLTISLETLAIYPIEVVETLLINTLLTTENILTKPKPIVIFKEQNSDAHQCYEVIFYVNNHEQRHTIKQTAWRNIWRILKQRNISLDSEPNNFVSLAKETSL